MSSVRDQLKVLAAQHKLPLARLVEEWSERAAIREYLGGMQRSFADQVAIADACAMFGIHKEL